MAAAEVTGQALLLLTYRAVQDNGLESGFTSGPQVCDLRERGLLSMLPDLSGPPVPRSVKKKRGLKIKTKNKQNKKKRLMALSSRFLMRSRDGVLKCLVVKWKNLEWLWLSVSPL